MKKLTGRNIRGKERNYWYCPTFVDADASNVYYPNITTGYPLCGRMRYK